MNLAERKLAFVKLGKRIPEFLKEKEDSIFTIAYAKNKWFDEDNTRLAFAGLEKYFTEESITTWLENYTVENTSTKNVGIIMAGNIPLVGFHDLFCVLMSGNNVWVKLSSKDDFLAKEVINLLLEVEPRFKDKVEVKEQLKGADAYIATGSDNSARYFEYYFAKFPRIIRKNRSSCAVLNGKETKEELAELGKDVFQYFGLGCRNVSKLFVPKGYHFEAILDSFHSFAPLALNNKYANNYDYTKAIYLLNKEPHFDSGFLLMRESHELVSPTSVLFYEYYEDEESLKKTIKAQEDKIQCIVSQQAWFENSIPLGEAQKPQINDYADGEDTMKFLLSL
jgi:hypothetical protein